MVQISFQLKIISKNVSMAGKWRLSNGEAEKKGRQILPALFIFFHHFNAPQIIHPNGGGGLPAAAGRLPG